MTFRYGSVSSGIECAAIAWGPLGWLPEFLAEIDPFASTVLHHHHSSGRPRNMPSPDAPGLSAKDKKARAAAIKAVASLPERANGVPNHGDMTTFEEWPDATIDLLVGGTPCQAYSVAGLGKGLDDPRGDLTLTYAAIARRYRPRWVVWENVFGVLSNDGGRAFASLLGLLSGRRVEVPAGGWKSSGIVEGYERAYGLAWRVLDTQYVRVDGFGRAIPQRRRRVFVVGYLGDWRRAAAVLFEREGLSGNPPPRRCASQEVAGTVAGGSRSRGGYSTDDVPLTAAFGGNRTSGPLDVATALTAHGGPGGRMDFESETFVATVAPTVDANFGRLQGASGQDANHGHGHLVTTREVAATLTRGAESQGKGGYAGRRQEDDTNLVVSTPVARTLLAKENDSHAADLDTYVAQTLRAEGFDASEDGTGRGTPLVPVSIPFDTTQITSASNYSNPKPGDPCHPLSAQAHPPAIAFQERGREGGRSLEVGGDVAYALTAPSGGGRHQEGNILHGWAVRRLTPRECCRLQGIPDDYFDDVVWRGKSPPPDGPVYKTLGNGFSANAVRWIGRRIEMVDAIPRDLTP